MNDDLWNKKSYNFSADVIRVLAIFGVVAIHTTNSVYARIDFFGGISWWIANIIDSVSRVSIPLFIMLSGYLLLNKNETFLHITRRVIIRILIPLIFWTSFYSMWNSGVDISLSAILIKIVDSLFAGGAYHLYFLGILVGLYFISPLLRSYLHSISVASQKKFMALLLIVSMAVVLYQYIFFKQCLPNTIFTLWIPYTGFFVGGYVLGSNTQKYRKRYYLGIFLLGFLSTTALNFYHYFLLKQGRTFLDLRGCITYYSDYYVSINVVLMSIGIFVFLLHYQFDWLKAIFLKKFIYSLARASFGIYLVHLFIVQLLEEKFHFVVDQTTLPLLAFIFSKWFIVLILSYSVTVVGTKVSAIRNIFGGK